MICSACMANESCYDLTVASYIHVCHHNVKEILSILVIFINQSLRLH